MLTSADPKILGFLDHEWTRDQFVDFLEIDGAVGLTDGRSWIVGIAVEGELFVERSQVLPPRDPFWESLKELFQKVHIELPLSKPHHNKIISLIDAGFDIRAAGHDMMVTLTLR